MAKVNVMYNWLFPCVIPVKQRAYRVCSVRSEYIKSVKLCIKSENTETPYFTLFIYSDLTPYFTLFIYSDLTPYFTLFIYSDLTPYFTLFIYSDLTPYFTLFIYSYIKSVK
jgi:hypothetical protein